MQVTTTVNTDAGVEGSLRQTLSVPLSMVPRGVPEDDTSSEGATASGLKEALSTPLVAFPESIIPKEEKQIVEVPSIGELEVGVVPSVQLPPEEIEKPIQKDTPSDSDRAQASGATTADAFDSKSTVTIDSGSGKVIDPIDPNETIVEVEMAEEETPPPPVTIFQLLCRKRYLFETITPLNQVPSEEDILDRFSIIDLWARRLFPSTFFILFIVYWVLFNYYITDEFPHVEKEPSDGLVVV